MRLVGLFIVVFSACLQSAFAYISDKRTYYGSEFLSQFQAGHLKNQDLLLALNQILQSAHIKQDGQPDVIVKDCNQANTEGKKRSCIKHEALGYDSARRLMFGTIDLQKFADGTYVVRDVYCERFFSDKDFGNDKQIGPGLLPSSGNIVNTEHTWPQSRFTGRYNKEMQKSDLHHLFPTDSEMNSRRSSFRFGHVKKDLENLKCNQNRLGPQEGDGSVVFEPPVNHRGNVARAIFYFATRYEMKISPLEQAALKEWNKADPVDDIERRRNDMIEDMQGNRNPYIDYPELIDAIDVVTFTTSK